jgi:hypothetical protein
MPLISPRSALFPLRLLDPRNIESKGPYKDSGLFHEI